MCKGMNVHLYQTQTQFTYLLQYARNLVLNIALLCASHKFIMLSFN